MNVDGGDLEDTYDRLNREFERSEARAQAGADRIEAVEDVAEDLFEEWEDELDLYTDADLRRRSQSILDQTRQRYERMIAAMHRAEASMDPVLDVVSRPGTVSQAQPEFIGDCFPAGGTGRISSRPPTI